MKKAYTITIGLFIMVLLSASLVLSSERFNEIAADKDPAGNRGHYRTVAIEPNGDRVTIESGRDRNTTVTRENPNRRVLFAGKVIGGAEPHDLTVADNVSKDAIIIEYKEQLPRFLSR